MALLVYNLLLLLLWPFYITGAFTHTTIRNFYNSRRRSFDLIRSYFEEKRESEKKREGQDESSSRDESRKREELRKKKQRETIWLHAASAGELEQARSLLRVIKKQHPQASVVISIFSLSVPLQEIKYVDLMFYLPADFFWSWPSLIRQLKPILFITMTWDIWPNLIYRLKRVGCPAFLCSAALSPDSWRLKFPWRIALRGIYSMLSGIGTVSDKDASLFRQLAKEQEKVRVTGDSRYDAVLQRLKIKPPSELQANSKLLKGALWILASTYRACDVELLPHLTTFLQDHPGWHILIFPHHVGAKRLKELEAGLKKNRLSWSYFSSLQKKAKKGRATDDRAIIVVDRLGLLAHCYLFSRFCYVGGGFHHRVHNTAEAAACGNPILSGPRISTSPIARQLQEEQLLFACPNGAKIMEEAYRLADNPALCKKLQERAKQFLKIKANASQTFYNQFLAHHLNYRPKGSP